MTGPYDARDHANNPHLVPIFVAPPEQPDPEVDDDAAPGSEADTPAV